jgi:hypothetical protein
MDGQTDFIKELYDLHSLQGIAQVIKSRRMKWATHVARLKERKVA